MDTIDSSLAIGLVSSHTHVVREPSPLTVFEVSSPLLATAALLTPGLDAPAVAEVPSMLGALTVNLYVALSRGVLLFGNRVIEPTGWFKKVAPSVVLFQPSAEPSVSVWRTGAPPY